MNSSRQLEFLEVTSRDFPVLLRMMRSLAEQPPSLPFDEREIHAALEKFLSLPEFGRAWLICFEDKTVGYIILTIGFSFEFRGTDAFVDELYVEPEYRRKGYARKTINFVEMQARKYGVNALHLEVDRENEAALELYRRAGYIDHGRYLMSKWLRPPPQ